MHFAPILDTANFPEVAQYAFRIAPYELWERRVSVLREQERENIYFRDYLDREFALEKIFEAVRRYHSATGRYPQIDTRTYDLFSFLGALRKR